MKKLVYLLATAALLVSCGTSRYVSGVPAGSAAPAALIEPLSYLTYVQRGGSEIYDPEGSKEAQKLLADAVTAAYPGPVRVLPVIDTDSPDDIYKSIEDLAYITNPKGLEQANVPEPVRSFLLDNGYRYGIMVYSSGFTRDRKDYAKAVAGNAILAVVTAVLTLGMVSVYGIAELYGSDVRLMVVDAQENSILYYDRTGPSETNPLDPKSANRQVSRLFKHFK